jgi:hypothetical protein
MSVISDILTFFEALKLTIGSYLSIKEILSQSSLEIQELVDRIENGQIDYGSKINVTGIYSDFVPVSRHLIVDLEKYKYTLPIDPIPCRPFSIEGYYCSSIQYYKSEYAGDPECIPVFFKVDTKRPTIPYLSGTTVEIKGKLISIPDIWKKFLDVDASAGILAKSIDLIGAEKNSFGVLPWKVVRDEHNIFKNFGGQIVSSYTFWSFTERIDNQRILCLNGGKTEFRQGNTDEEYENVHELYLVNILDEDELKSTSEYLSSKFGSSKVDAQWNMVKNPYNQTNWLKQKLGL